MNIILILILIWLAYGFTQVLLGLGQILLGLASATFGVFLYALSFVVEFFENLFDTP